MVPSHSVVKSALLVDVEFTKICCGVMLLYHRLSRLWIEIWVHGTETVAKAGWD